ncbi:hypothetical protein ABXN37_14745 [Piscinibacter sakaiensis]|uniref:Bll6633 protein n=1 Tax=Piscinibacter sakaiensis TaxID=1547922 RepID=A0A0K8P164_PISS1|nr:hypothetical protein [Piscinibacter sakaiensis]GAP36402.1 bll6633 protein [Piscinibacter sakaiensis]
MNDFMLRLQAQRLDDHRFYHHSRVNQSLHLVSAIVFVLSYGLLFVDPAAAALLAWGVSMTTRQAGHFFFEPRGFDEVNQVSDEHKEAIKVGYNIRRKVALMAAWVGLPLLLWWQPTLFGLIHPAGADAGPLVGGWWHDVGIAWLALGIAGVLLRVLQLALSQDLVTGLVWATKILTDPFHDILLYHKAPLHLLRGEWIDPMNHLRH